MKRTPEIQRLDQLERTVRALVVAVVFLVGALLAELIFGAETAQAALADRANYPQSQWGYLYYLTTAQSPDPERLAKAGAFMVASTSNQPILERSAPVQVAENLYRIDLRDLRWRWQDWLHVLRRYPYQTAKSGRPTYAPPLVVRMDWLVVTLADANASDAYYRLLYGGRIPKTRDEFLKFWRVDDDPLLRFGLIEGNSGVAQQRIRWIENRPAPRGYAWGTRDSLVIVDASDPLAHPDGRFRHDGEEWIVGIPKFSLASGQRGALQVYLLSDGAGKRIDKADGDLVEDYTKFRAKPQIRTAGSCIQCHHSGLNAPTLNELRRLIEMGVDVYANQKHLQEQLELFHLSDVARELDRNNEDFAAAVEMINGLSPQENAAAFAACVRSYDADLSLLDAARELDSTAEELRLALADWNNRGQTTSARLAALAHQKPIPRTVWEQEYFVAQAALAAWREE